MLHQLDTGDWIDLTDVNRIEVDLPFVRIWLRNNGSTIIIRFDSRYGDACAFRDKLAGLVNAAKAKEADADGLLGSRVILTDVIRHRDTELGTGKTGERIEGTLRLAIEDPPFAKED